MSRNNKDRWTFRVDKDRAPLTGEDVRYWKNQLMKILKVGFEFEFNLPQSKGSCKGDDFICACRHSSANDGAGAACWQKCARANNCSRVQNNPQDCYGTSCSAFVSACLSCADFTRDCESCPQWYDPKRNPDVIREKISNELDPSMSYGTLTRHGIHSVTVDGSLLGGKGAEIITTGRRPDFYEYYKMAKKVIDAAVEKGAYVNERCSIHAHVLTTYYGKIPTSQFDDRSAGQVNELERDMPEIIFANFHQLCRRYQNAITWMTMGLDDPLRLTRWEKYRVSILNISPVTLRATAIKDAVFSAAGGNKYGWVNYANIVCAANKSIKRFHVEMRVMDALLAPSAVAAIGCLYAALVVKAAEISRYGLLDIDQPGWLEYASEVKEAMLNNTRGFNEGDRFSDTSNLYQYYDDLMQEAADLLAQTKHILMKFGPCYDVLEKLAEKPCALHRCEGRSWKEIEDHLAVKIPEETVFDAYLSELIDIRAVDQCANREEWVSEVTRILSENPEIRKAYLGKDIISDRIRDYLRLRESDGEVIWVEKLGTVVFI